MTVWSVRSVEVDGSPDAGGRARRRAGRGARRRAGCPAAAGRGAGGDHAGARGHGRRHRHVGVDRGAQARGAVGRGAAGLGARHRGTAGRAGAVVAGAARRARRGGSGDRAGAAGRGRARRAGPACGLSARGVRRSDGRRSAADGATPASCRRSCAGCWTPSGAGSGRTALRSYAAVLVGRCGARPGDPGTGARRGGAGRHDLRHERDRGWLRVRRRAARRRHGRSRADGRILLGGPTLASGYLLPDVGSARPDDDEPGPGRAGGGRRRTGQARWPRPCSGRAIRPRLRRPATRPGRGTRGVRVRGRPLPHR